MFSLETSKGELGGVGERGLAVDHKTKGSSSPAPLMAETFYVNHIPTRAACRPGAGTSRLARNSAASQQTAVAVSRDPHGTPLVASPLGGTLCCESRRDHHPKPLWPLPSPGVLQRGAHCESMARRF